MSTINQATVVDTTQDPGLNYLSGVAVTTVQKRQANGVPTGNVVFNSVTEVRNVYIKQNNPGGSNGEIQIKSGSSFAGDAEFTYNPNTNRLEVDGSIVVGSIYADNFFFANNQSIVDVFSQGGGSADTGNITFSDTTLTSSNGNIKIHFTPSASPAVEFNFTESGEFIAGAVNTGLVTSPDLLTLNSLGTESGYVAAVLADGDTGRVMLRTDNGTTTSTWEFDKDGIFKLPAGGDIVDSTGTSVLGGGTGASFDQTLNTTDSVTFSQVTSDTLYFNSGASVKEQTGIGGTPGRFDIIIDAESNVFVRTDEGANEWKFGNNGNLSLPSNLVGKNTLEISTDTDNNIDLFTNNWDGGGVEVWLQHNNQVTITTDNGNYEWNFTNTGEFKFPNYVKQTSPGSVQCSPNVDTVVYTGTDQYQHTFKLLLQVEGAETTGQAWETQSCEMMVAKSFVSDKVAGSVYGLVYTSNSPLATFTTRWNATSNRVEVLCRPSSTTDSVTVRSFATEMSTSD